MPPIRLDPLTDDQKYHLVQLQHEQELCALRREFNILDRDSKRTQFTGGTKLAKLNKVYAIYKNEHENILTDLSVAASPTRKREHVKLFDILTSLLDEYDYYDDKVNIKMTHMLEFGDRIKQVEKSVEESRNADTVDKQFQDRVWAAQKTVATLENKLEVQMKKFNVICAKNKQMRLEIDGLLHDRCNFMTLWKRFIDKLTAGKRIMLDLIEQATLAYDQREECCSKLQALRAKVRQDLMRNTEFMREIRRKMQHDNKLEEFFNIKGRKRTTKALEDQQRVKRMLIRRKLEERLQKYEKMMSEITEFTEESEMCLIAKAFCKHEAENLMYFKYINDLMSEMESVNDHLTALHLSVDEERTLTFTRTVEQQCKLRSLEDKLENATYLTEECSEKSDDINATLRTLMDKIWALIKLCNCDTDSLLSLLGDNSTIEHYNVLLYLQILEKKIHEYLVNVAFKDRVMVDKKKISGSQKVMSEEASSPKIYLMENIVASSPCSLCVEHVMVSDCHDVVECVWSRKVVMVKLRHRLSHPEKIGQFLHNLSDCHIPRARQIIQRRYE